jgi:parallel beta-helix repeat protein
MRVLCFLATLVSLPSFSADAASAPPSAFLSLPNDVVNGSTVALQCGRVYVGTLNLAGKSEVTVKTTGTCGMAAISPGRPVNGWTRHQGKIYSAPLSFAPVQVALAGKPIDLAHYPNKPQTWLKGKSDNPYQLRFAMPNADLVDATLVYRPEDWLIETRRISSYANGAITLAAKEGDAFDPKPITDFYVEGKLWMLDSPGEWAYSNGRLYVWAPDGQSPEGKVWASPKASGINAADSRNITIDGVRVFSASVGIDGSNSTNLQIRNAEIVNSAEDGIFAGGSGLLVDNTRISHSVHNGILGFYGITGSVVTNSTVTATGTFGMPKRSKAAIAFEEGTGQRIVNNKVSNASYIGIRVHRDALVANNTVEEVCLILTDCGGIYTFAPDKQPLNVRIEGNTVRKLAQRQAYAIYLDDSANGVIVTRNIISDNPGGLEFNNGFNNIVTHNVFSSSGFEHILFNETGERLSIRHNQILNNTFISRKGEATYRMWSKYGGATVDQFAQFSDNVYTAGSAGFAEVAGTGMLSFNNWKARMKDGRATLKPAQHEPRGKDEKSARSGFSTWLDRLGLAQ